MLRLTLRTSQDGVEMLRTNDGSPLGARAFVSTRRGGVSPPPFASLNAGLHVGDGSARVMENRRRIARAAEVSADALVFCRQVHSADVAIVTDEDRGRGARDRSAAVGGVDGLATAHADTCLAILVADCVPILAFDPAVPAVGAAHAGWRGTSLGIATNLVRTMVEGLDARPERLRVYLGPSIGGRRYEVGREVVDAVREGTPHDTTPAGGHRRPMVTETAPDRFTLDLREANARQLRAAGVLPERIARSEACTFERADRFYSHRRDGEPTGRLLAGIVLRPGKVRRR